VLTLEELTYRLIAVPRPERRDERKVMVPLTACCR
jgi:hypothetical protein